jgi:hypothetical protein
MPSLPIPEDMASVAHVYSLATNPPPVCLRLSAAKTKSYKVRPIASFVCAKFIFSMEGHCISREIGYSSNPVTISDPVINFVSPEDGESLHISTYKKEGVVKKVICAMCFLAIASNVFAQDDYFQDQANDYKKKEISGIVMTTCAVSAAVIGTVMMVSDKENAYSSSNGHGAQVGFSSPKGGIGMLLAISAVPVLIVGTVKWIKGGTSMRRYNKFNQRTSMVLPGTSGSMSQSN